MANENDNRAGQTMEDVTDATGRQMVDDIFEESRLKRITLERDLAPEELALMELPTDPYVAFHGTGDGNSETLVVASATQQRRYLLKRFNKGRSFKAWQSTPVTGEKLRLLNMYRVMMGQTVAGAR